ncbi:MAG: hypothetical protein H6613_19390 [Ignavibacteriales bacterium]|nr:hypothetical protein [Ignavibacteriales bacterium]
MDELNSLVFPQSPNHLMLLEYLFFLTLLLLLPYLSVIMGTTLFSIMQFSKGNKDGDRNRLIFAKDLIDIFTVNKVMSIALGIIPIISLTFILAQLLYSSNLNFTSDLLFTLILFAVSLVYVYTYKYSFKLKNIFNLVNVDDISNQNVINEFEGLQKSNAKLLSKSGLIGFILLLVVAYILVGIF